jgi:hypothetical protein
MSRPNFFQFLAITSRNISVCSMNLVVRHKVNKFHVYETDFFYDFIYTLIVL